MLYYISGSRLILFEEEKFTLTVITRLPIKRRARSLIGQSVCDDRKH